jgi:hypothetical protein
MGKKVGQEGWQEKFEMLRFLILDLPSLSVGIEDYKSYAALHTL